MTSKRDLRCARVIRTPCPDRVFAWDKFACVVFILALILPAGSVAAEKNPEKTKVKPYAVIIGTVWTPDNRVARGVKIRIQRAGDKKPKWELVSDNNGEFAQRFPAGKADYTVWAEIKGKKERVAETKVHIESDERQDIGLHLPE